jgi:radical SAM superfamily enzyme YgiQ (UPF0313 family)
MPTILLLNPPSLPGTTANREGSAGMGALAEAAGGFVYPPHLLATCAAVLRQGQWRVCALDAVAAGLGVDATIDRLPAAEIMVLPVSYETLAADRVFLNRLRERKPLLKVLAIGPALRYPQVAHGLNDLADLLLAGEPELAALAAARHLLTGDVRPGAAVNPYTLAHAAYQPDGMLANLDALPMPAWDVFLKAGHSYPFLSILSSRGCPAGCRFCPYVAAQGSAFRAQTPQRTVNEIIYLAQRVKVSHIMFRDPVFAYDRSRVLAVCADLRQRQPGVTWECESRPEHFDERLLRAMQAAGCTTIKVGLESADPELLQAIGRVASARAAVAYVDQVTALIHACRQLGLICRVFVMAGLPGQTIASVQQTAGALRRMSPARLHVKPYHWYPGIALQQGAAPDLDRQIAVLQAAGPASQTRWRRLASRLTRI